MLTVSRTIARPLASKGSKFPIETILTTFVFVTLAYFHIVQAIKHSAFFASPSSPALLPTHAFLVKELKTWVPVPDEQPAVAELVQIVLRGVSSNGSDVPITTSMDNMAYFLVNQLQTQDGSTYAQSACYKIDGKCFTSQQPGILTLAFKPGTREPWTAALNTASLPVGPEGIHFEVEHVQAKSIAEMRSGKWVAYAARAFIVRFWDLAKQADSADILVVLLGYILMHGTFIRLFLSGRKLGSNLWLPIAMLSSSVAAFILSLPLSQYFGISLDPVGLSEALPFFVIAIGFDKALQLARAVFSHPQFLLPSQTSLDSSALPIKSAREVVLDAVDQVGTSIVRDYAIEVFVLMVGASSRVTGLKEFCALAALILAIDCVALFTFYISILTVLVEVHRIKALRASVPSTGTVEKANVLQRLSRSIFGEKGADANPNSNIKAADDYALKEPENPAGRLKLLLIVSFLTLHILNLCTTLTPDAAMARHHSHATHRDVDAASLEAYRKVDITTPSWMEVLIQLSEKTSHVNAGTPMVVKAIPSISLRAVSAVQTTSQGIDFTTGWSALINDSSLNKWIVFVLALSVFLNGYLLKGLAATAMRTTFIKQEEMTVQPRTESRSTESPIQKQSTPTSAGLPTPEFSRTPSPNSNIQPLPAVAKPRMHLDLPKDVRPFEECVRIFESGANGVDLLNDEEIILLAQKGKIAPYALEKVLRDLERAVKVRRALISRASDTKTLEHSLVPMENYDYARVLGACCENVVGYIPIPF
ncbi:hypothetical protein M422DRAFT_258144, partial [Sphaerobolus stellatus SS14]